MTVNVIFCPFRLLELHILDSGLFSTQILFIVDQDQTRSGTTMDGLVLTSVTVIK